MIVEITYEEILPIWHDYLWPTRISKIESNSAMVYFRGIDMKNMMYKPTFFAFTVDGKIAGVNSGHFCFDDNYRSRGLFVFPEYRGKGIAQKLLQATIDQAIKERALFTWSYPRKESWKSYESVGFVRTTEWEQSEMGLNAYCKKELR